MFDKQALKAMLRFEVEKISLAAAYVLAVVFGLVGAHDFYLGRGGAGALRLALTLSVVGLPVSAVWLLYDLLALPRRVREANRRLAVALYSDARAASDVV